MFNFHIPTIVDKFISVKLSAQFPPATKQSEKARQAMVADMVSNGATPEQAEKQAHGYLDLFPDGELKAIKSPYYAFDTWLRKVTVTWLGGKGAPKLLSIKQLDKAEQLFAAAQLKVLPLWQEFKTSYANKLATLQQNGGGYFELSDYPPIESLDSYFRMDFIVQPIANPDTFDLGGLTGKQADDLKQKLHVAMKQAAADATKDYALKLTEQLRKITKGMIAGKVDGKHTRFSSSTISNLQDMLAADLNIADQHEMTMALIDVKSAVRKTELAVKTGRESDKFKAASSAQQAVDKLAGLM